MAGNESEVKKEPEIRPGKAAVSGTQAGWNPPKAGWRPEDPAAGSAEVYPDTAVSLAGEYPDRAVSLVGQYPDTAVSPDRVYPDTAASSAGKYPDTAFSPAVQNPSAAPTAMLIRIFGKKDREPYGDIVHYDLKKPVPYQGSAELVLKIDAISRSLELPVSGSTFRSIRKSGGSRDNILPEEYWKRESVEKELRKAGNLPPGVPLILNFPGPDADRENTSSPKVQDTIYLQLIGRQHTSIQGRIWGQVTRKKYISFRSALELIYLLSEAV